MIVDRLSSGTCGTLVRVNERNALSITPSEATARVLAYSVHETYGTGLVTIEATFARSALAELNTPVSYTHLTLPTNREV